MDVCRTHLFVLDLQLIARNQLQQFVFGQIVEVLRLLQLKDTERWTSEDTRDQISQLSPGRQIRNGCGITAEPRPVRDEAAAR